MRMLEGDDSEFVVENSFVIADFIHVGADFQMFRMIDISIQFFFIVEDRVNAYMKAVFVYIGADLSFLDFRDDFAQCLRLFTKRAYDFLSFLRGSVLTYFPEYNVFQHKDLLFK